MTKNCARIATIAWALALSACAGQAMDEGGGPLEGEATEAEFGAIRQALGDCTSATLAITPSSPQPQGTEVTLSATSAGCTEPKYIWQVRQGGGDWVTIAKTKAVPSYGPVSYPFGVYEFRVKVRDKTDGAPAAKAVQSFEWTGCLGWNCFDYTGNAGCAESCADAGMGSFCAFIAEGGATCVADTRCDEAPPCGSSADCPDGSVCTINTCCNASEFGSRCFVAECREEPTVERSSSGGVTGASR